MPVLLRSTRGAKIDDTNVCFDASVGAGDGARVDADHRLAEADVIELRMVVASGVEVGTGVGFGIEKRSSPASGFELQPPTEVLLPSCSPFGWNPPDEACRV